MLVRQQVDCFEPVHKILHLRIVDRHQQLHYYLLVDQEKHLRVLMFHQLLYTEWYQKHYFQILKHLLLRPNRQMCWHYLSKSMY